MSDKPTVINLGTGRAIVAGVRMTGTGELGLGFGRIKPDFNIPLGADVPMEAVEGYDAIVVLSCSDDARRIQSVLSKLDTQMQEERKLAAIAVKEAREKAAVLLAMSKRTDLSFGEAQILMEEGYAVSRGGFNKPHRITLCDPDFDEASTQVYYIITTPSGDVVPWTASQCDLTKKDWYVLHTEVTA